MSAPVHGFHSRSFRKRHNQVLGIISETVAPLLRLGAAALERGKPDHPASWTRGIILGHNHLGDVLYRTCSLSALRRSLPACDWSYLTSPSSAGILEHNPHLAEVLPWNHGDDSWNLTAAHFRELRQRRFDVVLCTNTVRYHPDMILAAALGIPNRVGFVHKGFSGLVNHPVPIEFPSPYAGYFRSMVASVTGVVPDWPLEPQIFPGARATEEAAAAFGRMGFRSERPIVGCVLTTRQRRGNWPVEWMLAALRRARDASDFDIALCGDAADRAPLQGIAAELGVNARILAGQLSVQGFAAFLRRCAALFTLDSGPRHIGNAVGLPVVFARNMSHSRIEAGAYCEAETDIAPDGEYLSDSEIAAAAQARPVEPAANLLAERVLFAEQRA